MRVAMLQDKQEMVQAYLSKSYNPDGRKHCEGVQAEWPVNKNRVDLRVVDDRLQGRLNVWFLEMIRWCHVFDLRFVPPIVPMNAP